MLISELLFVNTFEVSDEIFNMGHVEETLDDVAGLDVACGFGVVLDGAGKIAFCVEVVAVKLGDLSEEDGVDFLQLSETESNVEERPKIKLWLGVRRGIYKKG